MMKATRIISFLVSLLFSVEIVFVGIPAGFLVNYLIRNRPSHSDAVEGFTQQYRFPYHTIYIRPSELNWLNIFQAITAIFFITCFILLACNQYVTKWRKAR